MNDGLEKEDKQSPWWKRLLKAVFFSPVNFLFIVALIYFALKAYLFDPSITNKLIVAGIVGLWMFWFIAKHMLALFLVLLLLGGGAYLYYDFSHRESKKCEASGGYWNENTKSCEAKLSLWERAQKLFQAGQEK